MYALIRSLNPPSCGYEWRQKLTGSRRRGLWRVCSGGTGWFPRHRLFAGLLCDHTGPAPRFPVRLFLRLQTHFDQRVARPGESWGHWAHLCQTAFSWLTVCSGNTATLSMTRVQTLSLLWSPVLIKWYDTKQTVCSERETWADHLPRFRFGLSVSPCVC